MVKVAENRGVRLSSEELHRYLYEYFGFDHFKEKQEEIIQSVLQGRDTFVIMPTGGGKSLCYQLPALILPGTAIVISPLIALMKNQVDSIRGFSREDNVAHFLNSSLTRSQMRAVKADIADGKTKLLYIAPETLTKDENLEFFSKVNVSFVAVDEAHCISEWGHDFRPEYRRIRYMINMIGENIPLIALTATATPKVREDIIKNLELKDVNVFITSFNRPNLYYEVRPKINKDLTIKQIIQIIRQNPGQSGIIYVQARKTTEEIAQIMEKIDVIVRDGLLSKCYAFYSHKDILKLEKFLRDKPINERLLGAQLLDEVIAYAETSVCRREFLLHYFGEPYSPDKCNKLCDNCANPREKIQVQDELVLALQAVQALNEKWGIKMLVDFLRGVRSQEILSYRFHKKDLFGKGAHQEEIFWHSLYRQAILKDFLFKDIEHYGVLFLTNKGKAFLHKPYPVEIALNRDYDNVHIEDDIFGMHKQRAIDEKLVELLKDIRLKVAKEHNVKPWVVFFDPSLEEMATYYPVTIDDLTKITGVSRGKAERYGKPFVDFIRQYVEENDIIRPDDFVVKKVVNKSRSKIDIIRSIDKKIPLDDIAQNFKISLEELLEEINGIVNSGTRVNIDYYINETVDPEVQDEIFAYFEEADTDSAEEAYRELKDYDITYEEVQLMRIKYLSEKAI